MADVPHPIFRRGIVLAAFTKVADNSTTIVEKITSQLIQSITDGELVPGQRLPIETELAAALGVGRNSLREAMKKLTALGIVNVRRGDGTYIAEVPGKSSYESLVYALIAATSRPVEVLELREKIETDVLELAATHGTAADVADLETLLDEYHRTLRAGDVDTAFDLDIAFHMRIAKAGQNRLIERIFENALTMFLGSIRTSLWPEPRNSTWVNRAHVEMIDAIRDHAVDRCADIVHRSVFRWAQQFDKFKEPDSSGR